MKLNHAIINDRYIFQVLIKKFMENINVPVDYILEDIKPFKSYTYKVTVNCLYKNRESDEEKTFKVSFGTDEYMTKDHR